MNSEALEIEFREAVARINAYTDPFPADVLLKLYAYYKKATNDYSRPKSKKSIINAFKTNALFPVRRYYPRRSKARVYRFGKQLLFI